MHADRIGKHLHVHLIMRMSPRYGKRWLSGRVGDIRVHN